MKIVIKEVKKSFKERSGKKMTNYDRIKQMSIEEMAEFLCKISGKNEKEIIGTFVCNYKEYYEQWLLQEVS